MPVKFNTTFLTLFSLLLCLILHCGICRAEPQTPLESPSGQLFHASKRLQLIKQRGTLIVGVKTDYPPFGMMNSAGEPVGFEHDLAEDIARRLGLRLQKVGVSGSNRLQKLQEGAIDIVLATTGDTADRRKIATMIEPNYYASGVTLFMPQHENVRSWSDTRGKKVCATQGSYYNRTMQQRYLLDLQIYNSARDAMLAVRDGRCIGYLFDNTALMHNLTMPEWHDYKMPLPPVMVVPWAIAIASSERGSEFEKILGDIVADWHRTGFLLERERAWNITPSEFLSDAYELWQRKDAQGKPFCRRGDDGKWNAQCRNKVFLTSTDVTGLTQIGLWIHEHTGIDLTIIYDKFDRGRFLIGLATTLFLTVCCVLGSLLFGIIGAAIAESRIFLLAPLSRAGCILARMTPPLPSMYVVLFGIGYLFGVSLSAIAVVIWCLCVYTGAGVMTALLDAAETYRITNPEFQLKILNTQKLARLASGSVTASLINVSKATMMASAFAVPELLSVSTSIISERGNTGVMMNLLLIIFLLIIFCIVRLLRYLEQLILEKSAI